MKLLAAALLASCAAACGGAGAGVRPGAETGGAPKDPFGGDEGPRAAVAPAGGPARLPDVERRAHALINAERAKIGAAALAWDEKLARIARDFSADMAARHFFGHVSPDGRGFVDRYKSAGYRCSVTRPDGWLVEGGENVFAGNVASGFVIDADGKRPEHLWTTDELAQQIVAGWMASPPHRKNLLERYWKREGIGLATSPDGDVLVTQDFC